MHIDVDPSVISANYETAHALVGDARLVLEALLSRVQRQLRGSDARRRQRRPRRSLRARAQAKFDAFNRLAAESVRPIRPERVLAELQRVLPRDAIVVADPGTPCPYVSAYYELREPGRHFITNRAHGALGYSMSAATGAWFAQPHKKCVALMGDGSFGFSVGELETVVRRKVPLLMIVFSNAAYGWIKASQKASYGRALFLRSTSIAPITRRSRVGMASSRGASKILTQLGAVLARSGGA